MRAFLLLLFSVILAFSLKADPGLTLKPQEEIGPSIKTIVIDPGHGGKDPGCHGDHSKEKDIVLQIAKKFGAKIKLAFPEVNVIYTRTTDKFVPLHERAAIANRNKADLFISLHVNWHSSNVSGTEAYVMGLHSAEENLNVAKRENSSILLEENYKVTYQGYDPNSNEGHIWLTMVQNAYLDQSINFATMLDKELSNVAKRKSRGIKQAGFVVLRMTTMPSILVEAGFLSNDKEEAYLMSADGQNKLAKSLFNAFRNYKIDFEGHSKPTVPVTVKTDNDNYTDPMSSTKKKVTPVYEYIPPTGKVSEVQFKVQLSASRSKLDSGKGVLGKVTGLEVVYEEGRYKYLVGKSDGFSEALDVQNYWRKNGFSGAFVVAYRHGNRIPIKEAKQLAIGP